MEHRLSLRTPLKVNVAIYYNGLGLLQAHSVDVSRHGMLVQTWPMTLPLHAIVDIAFPLQPSKRSAQPQRTPAMVVRHNEGGVGLMFANEVSLGEIATNTYQDSSEDYCLIEEKRAV